MNLYEVFKPRVPVPELKQTMKITELLGSATEQTKHNYDYIYNKLEGKAKEIKETIGADYRVIRYNIDKLIEELQKAGAKITDFKRFKPETKDKVVNIIVALTGAGFTVATMFAFAHLLNKIIDYDENKNI